MSLDQIKQKLEKELNSGNLLIGKKVLGLSGIEGQFEQLLNTKKIKLTQVKNIQLKDLQISFSGKTTLFNIPSLEIFFILKEINNKIQLTFTADLVSSWKFKKTKPQPPAALRNSDSSLDNNLLEPLFTQLTIEKPTFIFSTYIYQHDVFNLQIKKGLSFVWVVDDSDPLNISAFAAPLKVKDSKLLFSTDLPGEIQFGTITFKQLRLDLSSRLSLDLPPSDSSLSIKGVLTAGTLVMDVEGRLEADDFNMMLSGEFRNMSINGFAALKHLTGINNLGSFLPQKLKAASDLTLKEIKFGFNPLSGTVTTVGLGISAIKEWSILPGLFEIKNILFLSEVKYPLDVDKRKVNIMIRGIMKIAGGDVGVTALMPDYSVYGELLAQQTIKLRRFIQEFAPGVQNVPQLDIDQLGFRIDPTGNVYSMQMGIASDWTIDLGVTNMVARQLFFNFSSSNGSFEGEIKGVFGLAGSDFLLTSKIPEFSISASLVNDQTISLKELFKELLKDHHAVLGKLPALNISEPKLSVTPKSGEFEFVGACHDTWNFPLGIASLDLTDISLRIKRTKISATKKQITADIKGRFSLDSTTFDMNVEKYGDANDWKFTAQIKENSPIDLITFLTNFMPAGISLPAEMASLKIKEVELTMDLGTQDLSVKAKTVSQINFAALGSVKATDIEFQIKKKVRNSSKYYWRLKVSGQMNLSNGFALQGALECYDDEQGTGFMFTPEMSTPIKIPLPLPQYKGEDICLNLMFGPLAIAGKNNKINFKAGVTVGFVNIPEFFDNIIADDITAAFEANEKAFSLVLDRVFEDAEFQIPPIPVTATQKIELGKMRLDLTDIELLLGDKIEIKGKFGVGIPSKLNNVFGVKDNGKPHYEIFNTYIPSQPTTSLINFHFGAGTDGISFTLLDSPFKLIKFFTKNGKTWCDCDFGEYGAVQFMIPMFSLDSSSSSFKGAGAVKVVRPLKIPLSLIKNFLNENGHSQIADLLPAALAMKEVKLLDSNNKINISKLFQHIEAMGGEGFTFSDEIKNGLKVIEDKFDRLPDKLKQYFNITIPDEFSFDIVITPDGGATINIQLDGAPIRFLFGAPKIPMLYGIEFRGFSFGEILSGQLFLVKADFSFDCFDIYQFAAAFLPTDQLKFLADSRSLQNSIIVRNLTMFIFYHARVPIPIPLFYDELGIEYKGIEDIEFQTHVHFPQPRLDPMEMIKILGELQKFFADKDYLLDTSKPLKNIDPTFTLGANYIRLPKYLSGKMLGKKTKIGSISLYLVFAHLLNGMKTFSVNRLMQAVPIKYRLGTQTIDFLAMTYQVKWLITTPDEFSKGAYKKLNLNASDQNGVLKIIPKQSSVNEEGVAVFLKGTGTIANSVQINSTFALFGSGTEVATGFETNFDVAKKLIHFRLKGLAKVAPKESTPFQVTGLVELKFLNSSIMKGTIGFDNNGLTLSGQMNMFPVNPVLNVKGLMRGQFSENALSLSGDVKFQVAQYFILSGAAAQITHEKISISGTSYNQTFIMSVQKITNGVRLSAGLSAIKAGSIFQITGPSPKGGPNLSMNVILNKSPIITLKGSVNLLNIKSQTQIVLSPTGYDFKISGKVFNVYSADLQVKTSIDLLKTNLIAVTAEMKNDFFTVVQSSVGQKVKGLSDQAVKKVDQAQKQINLAQKEVDKIIKQIQQKIKQIENEIKSKERQAQNKVNNAKKVVNQFKTKLNNIKKQVNRQKNDALKIKNKAQVQINSLRKDIQRSKNRIKALKRSLSKSKVYQVLKRSQLGAQIAAEETKKAGLIASRNTANQALNMAKKSLQQAVKVANQAINLADNKLSGVQAVLTQATKSLANIRKLFNTISRDIRVRTLSNVKKSKDTLLAQAKKGLTQVKVAQKKLLNVSTFVSRNSTQNIFRITSAGFSGKLNVLQSAKVTMTLKYQLMNGPNRTLRIPFDFKNPSSSLNAIFIEIKQVI